jgi:lipid A disaccharide synthetase
MDISKIKNLHIMIDIDAHDLVLRSDIICSFSSTLMLESAIAGKPVIVPHFDEALEKEYTDLVKFKDSYHLFNVAYSIKEFERLIVECLRNPIKISESQMNGRYAIFEKYVSSMSGNALDKYVETVNNAIKT